MKSLKLLQKLASAGFTLQTSVSVKMGFAKRLNLKFNVVPLAKYTENSQRIQANIPNPCLHCTCFVQVEHMTSGVTKDEGCQYEPPPVCNIMVPSPPRPVLVPLKHNVSTQAYYYREKNKNKGEAYGLYLLQNS